MYISKIVSDSTRINLHYIPEESARLQARHRGIAARTPYSHPRTTISYVWSASGATASRGRSRRRPRCCWRRSSPWPWKRGGLPDGKIRSLPFLGLRQGGGRGGAIQGKEGIKFCSVAQRSHSPEARRAKHIRSKNLAIAIWQPCFGSVTFL